MSNDKSNFYGTKILDFDRSLNILSSLFVYCGMSIESRKRTSWETIKNRCIYMFNFLWLNTDTVGEIVWLCIEGATSGKSFTEITFTAPCTSICVLANVKSYIYMYYEDTMSLLVEEIRELETERESAPKNEEKEEIVASELGLLNMVVKVVKRSNVSTVIVSGLNPIVLMTLFYFQTNELHLFHSYSAVYPFDAYNIYIWPVVYIHQFWSGFIVVLELGGIDCLYYTCCTYITIQFRLLQCDVTDFLAGQSLLLVREDELLRNRLRKLVHWHQRLIRCVRLLDEVYSKSTLFNFVVSSVLICLTGFNATVSTHITHTAMSLVFLFMNLIQIFLLCFYGDMIMRASMELNDAVYNCQWYLADSKIRKKLLFMKMRSQLPCKLRAYMFADVNLRSFTKVLSTAWSYFALLQTIYSSPRH